MSDGILFDRTDQLTFLGLGDDPLASCKDDLGHTIGLCDKVCGAHTNAAHLGAFLRSHDDDRDILQLFVGFHRLNHIKAAHNRHDDIQQNQRIRVGLGAQDRKRFHTARYRRNFVIHC